jgi:methyltransferase (TIGR00027 family)
MGLKSYGRLRYETPLLVPSAVKPSWNRVSGNSMRSPPASPVMKSNTTPQNELNRNEWMPTKRIEFTTSRTAEWTCICRAISSLEKSRFYQSDDRVAIALLPYFLMLLIRIPFAGRLFLNILAARGIYEYVIARTKYIDAVFRQALSDRFTQILIFGAGFDTRAMRFQQEARQTRIFELDAPSTQEAKIRQYRKRHLSIPSNLVFIAIDFDRELLPDKLDFAGFRKDRRSLFILEGLLMYLEQESVHQTFQTIQQYAGAGSRVAFDYLQASVLRHENTLYGQSKIAQSVRKAGEQWRFGIEPAKIAQFVKAYGFEVSDHRCAQELEAMYFQDADGRRVGRVNGTHCIVSASRP